MYPGEFISFSGSPQTYDNLIWASKTLPKPTLDQITAADLGVAKGARIALAKYEASTRIYAQYPAWMQSNCAMGLYDALPTTDPLNPANIKAGINAIRTAEQAAETAINALTSSDEVDAFTW